ncbi:unnamed protein product, partial [Brenthis ino]
MMADKGLAITPKHIYTIINNNRAGFRDLIMEVFDIRERELSISVNDGNYSNEKCADQTTDTLTSLTAIKINLVISQEKWHIMKPQEKVYGKRIYGKLRQGWADVVAEALRILSRMSRKNQLYTIKKPTKGVDVVLQCNVDSINPDLHSGKKRRQLRGARRTEVADYLIDGGKDAVTCRRKKAGRIKNLETKIHRS